MKGWRDHTLIGIITCVSLGAGITSTIYENILVPIKTDDDVRNLNKQIAALQKDNSRMLENINNRPAKASCNNELSIIKEKENTITDILNKNNKLKSNLLNKDEMLSKCYTDLKHTKKEITSKPTSKLPSHVQSIPATSPSQAPSFQNEFIKITLKSAHLSSDKTTLTLALQFSNLLSEKINIAAERNSSKIKLNMMSNRGEVLSLPNIIGDNGLIGLSVVWPGMNRENEIANYTGISANMQTTVIFKFETHAREYPYRPQPIEGNSFSFSGQLFRHVKNGASRSSVGISDIEI